MKINRRKLFSFFGALTVSSALPASARPDQPKKFTVVCGEGGGGARTTATLTAGGSWTKSSDAKFVRLILVEGGGGGGGASRIGGV